MKRSHVGMGIAGILVLILVMSAVSAGKDNPILTASMPSPGTVSLAWTASTTPNVQYYVYHSATSGSYSPADRADAGVGLTYSWSGLGVGTHYFVVTSRLGTPIVTESAVSNEVSATIGSGPAPINILSYSATRGWFATTFALTTDVAVTSTLTFSGHTYPVSTTFKTSHSIQFYFVRVPAGTVYTWNLIAADGGTKTQSYTMP